VIASGEEEGQAEEGEEVPWDVLTVTERHVTTVDNGVT